MCIPFHEVTLLITIHYWAFDRNRTCDLLLTRELLYLLSYKGLLLSWWVTIPLPLPCQGSALPLSYKTILRSRLDSNQREWVCNPLPPVFLHHSATGPFLVVDAGYDPTTSCVSDKCSTKWANRQFCSPGRLRSDSLHYVTVALPRLSYKTIFLRVQSDSNRHLSA